MNDISIKARPLYCGRCSGRMVDIAHEPTSQTGIAVTFRCEQCGAEHRRELTFRDFGPNGEQPGAWRT